MGFEIGREYFEVDFQCACDVLKSAIESTKDKRKQAESAVCELCLQDSDNQKFDKDFYGFVSLVLSLDAPDLALIIFNMKGLEARTYLKNKKSADKAREKNCRIGMEEVKRNKREFNARTRELLKNGYTKCAEYKNKHRFRKHTSAFNDITVTLVQGWKSP